MKCNQENCDQKATYRYTWPGHTEAGICAGHPDELAVISALMVPILPFIADTDTPSCSGRRKGGRGPTVVNVNCDNCGNIFTAKATDRKRGWARFCSKSCKAIKQEARRKANERK